MGITATAVLRTHGVTVTGTAHGRIPDVLGWVPVEEGPAELTVTPRRVVLAAIAYSSARISGRQVDSHVKVAALRVPIALTLPTGMSLAVFSRVPGKVVIEILTLLTVETTSVMLADTGAVHHALGMGRCPRGWGALRGMPVAEAVAADDKLVEGIVVFFPDFPPWVEQVVSQSVKPSEVHSEVGDLQQVLDP